MIKVSTTQFQQNPTYYQSLAQKEPVCVSSGKGLEVVLDYTTKPFVSLYDVLLQIASQFSDEEREILANIDDEADFSTLDRK